MTPYEIIRSAIADVFKCTQEPDAIRVLTQCMYPSNAFVQVVVHGGANTFVVSDDGGALRELDAVGVEPSDPPRALVQLVSSQGLRLIDGVIRTPNCTGDELPVAIALVANASKEAAEWLFGHTKIKRNRNFREVVSNFLRTRYDHRVVHETLVGKSNKAHKFDNLIRLENGRRLIVDAVVNDPASINSRVVANLDIRSAEYEGLEQRIVYDDDDEWRPEDLSLLQVGATVVAFSKVNDVLGRLVSHA
jgi:hypothetical protein